MTGTGDELKTRFGSMARRLSMISLILLSQCVRLALRQLRTLLRIGRSRGETSGWLVETITKLGPAFIKVAQMLSTRADLLPPHHCKALAALYDNVAPVPAASLEPVLVRALGEQHARAVVEAGSPVAAGSIACVYRATLADGREVAVKVRRPGIEETLHVDLAIMRAGARWLSRLPWLRGVPFTEIVAQLTSAVYAQLDFEQERENLCLLRANLAEFEGVRVPEVHAELCSDDVLVMEFLTGLRRRKPGEVGEAEGTKAVIAALHAVYQMLFLDGLVHCDLHPGNLYLDADGTVTIVDAGFTVRLSQQAQDKFSSFFYYMSVGKGERCAEVVLSTATPGQKTDADGFRRDITTLIAEHTGVAAADFDLVRFATRLFDIQRRYGLYADPQFVFPILSLLVLEGSVRDLAPDIDFQDEALPFLASAMISRTLQMSREVS